MEEEEEEEEEGKEIRSERRRKRRGRKRKRGGGDSDASVSLGDWRICQQHDTRRSQALDLIKCKLVIYWCLLWLA